MKIVFEQSEIEAMMVEMAKRQFGSRVKGLEQDNVTFEVMDAENEGRIVPYDTIEAVIDF